MKDYRMRTEKKMQTSTCCLEYKSFRAAKDSGVSNEQDEA